MPVAIRAITRLQDADDLNVSLGAGVDEYALYWDNDTAKFVLRAVAAGVTDHGALTGLADDDHTGYALLAGRAGGTTLYGGTAANEDITIHGTSNATRTTSYVLLQPTAGYVGIGTAAPKGILHILSANVAAGAAYNSFGDAYFSSNDAAATDVGGTIALGGQFTTNTYAVFGRFAARLEGAPGQPKGYFSIETVGTEGASYVMRERVRVSSTGVTTITHTDATDAAVVNVLKLAKNVFSTGVGATGLGAGLLFTLESSTTINTSAASVQAIIYEATHASRKFDLVGNAYDTAIREGWRVRGNGAAPAIGFLGATPIARIAHVADPSGGATVDAEARSAINSILATLEGFGFHATS